MPVKTPRVLIFTLDYLPKHGGLAHYLYGIARELPKGKIEVLTDNRIVKGALPNIEHPVHYKTLIRSNAFPKWLPAFKALKQVLKSFKADIVIVPNILPLGLVAKFVCAARGIDYYISLHGLDLLNAQKSARKKYVARYVLKHAKAIIVNSNYTKKITRDFINNEEKPIVVLYPCPLTHDVKIHKDIKKLREDNGYNFDQTILLSVCRLVRRKGIHRVIKSLPAVIKREPNIRYIVVGSGPELKSLQDLVRTLQLEEFVQFLTNVSDEELIKYYQMATMFIMPNSQIGSDVEGFGLVFLEANQHCKPVIGGRSGGVPEAIVEGKSGLLVDTGDNAQIVESILLLAQDKILRQDMGMYAKDRVDEKFIWRHEVNKLVFLYNNI